MVVDHGHVHGHQRHGDEEARQPQQTRGQSAVPRCVIILRALEMLEKDERRRQHLGAAVHHDGDAALQQLRRRGVWPRRGADPAEEAKGRIGDQLEDVVGIEDGVRVGLLQPRAQLRQHASAAAGILQSLGFSRVVLAREMPIGEIRSYVRNSPIDTEVFVHGAFCVCESGGCLMSSVIGRRSGNRGECAQPCRLPYRGANPYPLSMKDNCLASRLQELTEAGVKAFKIEGRMKSADYVFRVTSVYRKLLDEKRMPTEKELDELERAFSRSGFTDGYFTGRTSPDMFGVRREEDKRLSREISKTARTKTGPHGRENTDAKAETASPMILPERTAHVIMSPKEQLGYVARPEGRPMKDLSLFSDANRIDVPLRFLPETDISGMEDRISILLPRVTFDSGFPELERRISEAKKAGIRRATVPNLSYLPINSTIPCAICSTADGAPSGIHSIA